MKKQIKAWAILTPKGTLKEWQEKGSGARIVFSKKEAIDYIQKKGTKVVQCVITFDTY